MQASETAYPCLCSRMYNVSIPAQMQASETALTLPEGDAVNSFHTRSNAGF